MHVKVEQELTGEQAVKTEAFSRDPTGSALEARPASRAVLGPVADVEAVRASKPDRDDGPAVDQVAMEVSPVGEAGIPSRVLIAPWGEVRSSAGSFILDVEAASATIAAFEAQGTDLPVDYEHQTLGGTYSSPDGQAPAAGWIKVLSAVSPDDASRGGAGMEPGLWADVEWTAEASKKLRSRQYRYLSPVALVRRRDHRLVGIHSVALTNKPAILGMRPVVNSAMATAPDGNAPTASTVELRRLLAVDDAAADEVVLVAAAQRIQVLEQKDEVREASGRVSRAMAAGKLTVAQRDWALSLARRDPAAFNAWEASAPVVVPLGRLPLPADEGGGAGADRRAVELSARTEWRANRAFLEQVCTEEAYVANALRECRP